MIYVLLWSLMKLDLQGFELHIFYKKHVFKKHEVVIMQKLKTYENRLSFK